jgi:hypothetical protein
VAVVAMLAYAPALLGEFILDDYIVIVDNEAVRSWADAPGYFTRGMWPEKDLGAPDAALYRPLVLLAFLVVYQVAGLAPLAFHAVSVALHAVNSVLVWLLLRRLGGAAEGAAVVGALVFALHPVHVESVAWIADIGDLLATAFVVLAVWLYAQPSRRAYATALGCSALALLSKEIGVAIPALALGADWLRGHRVRWGRVGGLIAVTLVYFAVRRAALGAAMNTPLLSVGAVLVAVDYALGYVSMAVMPTQLGLFLRPPEQIVGVTTAVVAIVAVAATACWARSDRVVRFAALWFAATLAPALALVFNVGGTYAQRFLYLPSVAVALIATRATVRPLPRPAGAVAVAARWFLESAPLVEPWRRAFVYNSLGRVYLAAGDAQRSLAFHGKELEASPERAGALIAIGHVHARRADFDQAARAFEAAWTADRTRWEALYNLAVALAVLGRDDEARQHFSTFSSGAPPGPFAVALADARRRLESASAPANGSP